MTLTSHAGQALGDRQERSAPRFGGVLWRIVRLTNPVMLPLAGTRWNPVFAILEHRGRKSGRPYATPIAARRVAGGFVISLAFGAQVDWYRNLQAAGGGTIRWRGTDYPVTVPTWIAGSEARAAFLPVQRLFLRLGGGDGFIR